MLKTYFCPTFSIKSFIFLVVVLDWILYLITLIKGGVSNDSFLGVNTFTLIDFGAKCPNKQHQASQLYRWIMPMFLHAGFLHILFNTLFALIFGTMLESIVGQLRIFYVWIISGMGGILMGTLISHDASVGASTSEMGVIGAVLAFVTINWEAMKNHAMARCMLLIMMIWIGFMQILFGFSTGGKSNTDNWGHLGGFVTGYFASLPIIKILETDVGRHRIQNQGCPYEKIMKYFGLGVTVLWFLLGYILFYTVSTKTGGIC